MIINYVKKYQELGENGLNLNEDEKVFQIF